MAKGSIKKSFHFDDCVICQAMKKADERGRDLSLTELRKVFTQANIGQNSKKRSKTIPN